jgi:hypothetical protein
MSALYDHNGHESLQKISLSGPSCQRFTAGRKRPLLGCFTPGASLIARAIMG